MSDRGFQFTHRQGLAAITLLCIALALSVVEPRAGIFLAALAAGVALLVFGAMRRARSAVLGGLFLAMIGGGLLVYRGATVSKWVGRAKLPVHVLVIDTDTFEPVEGGTIEVLRGPPSPIEGRVSSGWLSQFTPADMGPDYGDLVTDARGECNFDHEFFASGSDGLFEKGGAVRLGDIWVRASAPGRGAVLIPVDGQSCNSRNIVDRSPVFVTVPLRKHGGN